MEPCVRSNTSHSLSLSLLAPVRPWDRAQHSRGAMSVVTVQVGQCGNQLGASLFQALHDHANQPPAHHGHTSGAESERARTACRRSFFRDGGVARAVIIDTEPKVIQRIVATRGRAEESTGGRESAHGKTAQRRTNTTGDRNHSIVGGGSRGGGWRYDSGTQVCCHAQGGAANNWAYGYHAHGATFTEACLEGVRRETERCDRLTGLCILHSLAGGTGSGLGTCLTEALRDELPSAFLLNTVVGAHSSGEVILQNYNTLFTLSKLAKCSDGVLVVENDAATAVCRKLLRLERPSHTDLNEVICSSLVGALSPTATATTAPAASASAMGTGVGQGGGGEGGGMSLHLGDKLAHLCPNKDFVFLRASIVPQIPDGSRAFTRNTWEALTRRAYQMHITGSPAEIDLDWRKKAFYGAGAGVGLNQSVASLLTFHGTPVGGSGATQPQPPPPECFRSRGLYAGWCPTPLMECRSPLRLHGHERAISLLSNSQAVLGVLETAVGRSRDMFSAGAYVHQYALFGAEREDFEEAFLGVEQAVENYRSLG
ncbi:unnamed protein product [Ectocarpus sp. 12 AP-2014]